MDIFTVIGYTLCDDRFYGFFEKVLQLCLTFEEAKIYVDSFIENKYVKQEIDDNMYFIRIIRKKTNSNEEHIEFDSNRDL